MNLFKETDRDARTGRALFLLLRRSNFLLYVRKIWVLGLGVLACCYAVSAQASAAMQLHADTEVATAGYYQLTWFWPEAPANVNYSLLEKASDAQGAGESIEMYYGPDTASVISGKPNGSYLYQVRAMDAERNIIAQSEQVKVLVSHHSLVRAFIIFSLGALVFIATLIVVLRGSAKFK